ncbi:hypothetical protein KGQ31_03155 [Patescibacteria group bacterium]|nr:hypothetical protein [Patescibacteria group bacterium]
MFGSKKLDLLAVGDITTDAFIRLIPPYAHSRIDRGNLELCMNFGDKIPYESVEEINAVGNSPNAAVSAVRIGLSSGLVTDLGDDDNARKCLAVLKKEGVDTTFVKTHRGKATNYHYVLWFESDRTILVKHHDYGRIFPDIGEPKWLYLSSLGQGTENYHDAIAAHLEKHPAIKLCFQPGTFQIGMGSGRLARVYKNSELAVINRFEAGEILKITGTGETGIKKLLTGISSLGPKTVLITDGPAGAYFYDSRKGETLFAPPYPDPKPPLNRTGAGDAYASTFVSATILGKTPAEALRFAGINSMSVVQQVGAQRGLLHGKDFEPFLAKAPDDYEAAPLS